MRGLDARVDGKVTLLMSPPYRHFIFVALAVLFMSAFGAHVSAAAQEKSENSTKNIFDNLKAGKSQTVVVYGTSLSINGAWAKALGDYFEKSYPGKVTFINAASAGQQSNWGFANLEKRVLSKKPDLVFIEFSINDAASKHGISLKKSESNLDAMVRALRSQNPQVEIVIQTMNPAWDSDSPKANGKKYGSDRPKLDAYYAVYRDYARRNDLPFVDNYPVWLNIQKQDIKRFRKMTSDGIHPDVEASLETTWVAVASLLERARK